MHPVIAQRLKVLTSDRLPRRPYCTDDLRGGVRIRDYATAIQKRYIQLNPPSEIRWIVFDLDWSGGTYAWYDAGVATPHWTTVSPDSGRCHHVYGLQVPVCRTDAARLAPLRYLAAVERTYAARLQADPGYAGLLTKTPLHPAWRTLWWGRDQLYDLAELADYVDLLPLPSRRSEIQGTGRNVALFEDLRGWAYKAVRRYWARGLGAWMAAVQDRAERINSVFLVPLPVGEVRSTAKSVARWTWRHITPAGLRDLIERTHTPEIQAERGRRCTPEQQAAKGRRCTSEQQAAKGRRCTSEQQAAKGRRATNQVAIAALGGIASGQSRRQSREQQRETARLLRAQGCTHRDIAAKVGVPRRTVSRWLSGS